MARADTVECAAQCCHVERAFEPVCARHVIGGAGRIELLQEPQALLRVRQRQRFAARRRHDRQRGEGHAFVVQRGQERRALRWRQPGKARCDLRVRGIQCI
ncbi:hypothetical protein D3C72_2167770 [compost metagenome]